MTDKKTEELNEQDLDQVTGGGVTEELFGAYNVGAKAKGNKEQLTAKANSRGRVGIRATKGVVHEGGGSGI